MILYYIIGMVVLITSVLGILLPVLLSSIKIPNPLLSRPSSTAPLTTISPISTSSTLISTSTSTSKQTTTTLKPITTTKVIETFTLKSTGVFSNTANLPNLDNISNVIDISAGNAFSLLLKTDNSIQQIGGDASLQPTSNLTSSSDPQFKKIIKISAGYIMGVVLIDSNNNDGTGSVFVWGSNSNGLISNKPTVNDIVQISAGREHILAVNKNGDQVYGWGSNIKMINGINTTINQAKVPTSTLTGRIIAVAAGHYHSLALNEQGYVFSWGDNTYGQTDIPPEIQGFVIGIQAGAFHSIALVRTRLIEGGIVVIGGNFPSTVVMAKYFNLIKTFPKDFVNSNIEKISFTNTHIIVLKLDKSVYSWGYTGSGAENITLTKAKKISAGYYHSLFLI